ncbi:MAG: VOC family protein [Geminicoccaceae bacterium]
MSDDASARKRDRWLRHCASLLACVALAACAGADSELGDNALPPITLAETGVYLPGKIVFTEHLSAAPERLRAFYASLFGWQFVETDAADYTLALLDREPVAGFARIHQRHDAALWLSVFATDDLGVAFRQALAAGGASLLDPVDAAPRGSVAIVEDAERAPFALLQAQNGDPLDTERQPAAGSFVWHELWSGDPAAAAGFYDRLFAYDIHLRERGEAPYSLLVSQDQARAGIYRMPNDAAEPQWLAYILVDDLEQTLTRVPARGGEVLFDPDQRGDGTAAGVAIVADPLGAVFGLVDRTLLESRH